MSLPHAIVTSLLEKPCSGAELARRFDKSLGYFWPATHQQIYRELGKLEDAGLVESSGRETSRGRAREYRVLPAGRAELAAWCRLQADPRPVRDELMVRMRAAGALGGQAVADVRAEIARHRELHRDQLALYEGIERADFTDSASDAGAADAQTLLQHAVLKAGIVLERAWLEWAQATVAEAGYPAAEVDSSPVR